MKWFIATLALFCVAVLGVAYYRQWVTVETQPGKETSGINITVDRGKAREDLQGARDQAKGLVQKAREGAQNLVGPSALEGEVMVVSPEFEQMMLQVGDKTYTIVVAKDAAIQRDDQPAALDALQVGDKATIKVKEEDGIFIAHTISAHSN